jgi:group II intron reverse transcriptase/maturase
MAKESSEKQKEQKPTVKNLRHAEYYDQQKEFDELYKKSQGHETFDGLMEMILSRENILLAYRNLKTNKGSKTAGTDGLTISDIERLTPEEVVETVRQKVNAKQGYRPKPVRRVEIPKPYKPEEKRKLGIPGIWDRLIQQCIKQVLEPICEARFSNHSYGFRPGRSVENAIADMNRNLNMVKCDFVCEFDIKGFFDNVNHSKLIKQIWALGIHDKQLIYVIKQILKAPIKLSSNEIVYPEKGTPQGGVISPLLANIVLNELDQWIESQWEENPVVYKYYTEKNNHGKTIKSNGYRAMRGTKLKEMHIVRYADDFRIFCKTKSQADKVLIATKMWLKERLGLDISEEKTRVVNAKRKWTEFLGFKTRLKAKGNKMVTESHICDKAKERIKKELKEQVKKIAKPKDKKEALNQTLHYNSMVEEEQNYYQIASCVSLDFNDIAREIKIVLNNRLRDRLQKKGGRALTGHEKDRYGKSEQLRYDAATGAPIYPAGYIQAKDPMCMKYGKTPYTPEGRALMHKNLEIDTSLMIELMRSPVENRSAEYADNRISLYSEQNGKCAITGIHFESTDEIHCHHKIPIMLGGTDEYGNLILVLEEVHKLIHATAPETINKYLASLNLTKGQLKKLNKLRKQAQLEEITL